MTAKKGRRKRAKRAAKRTVALIPQPHGGALLSGGQPGQTPGPGRPKNEIRAKLREIAYGKGLDFLAELLEGKIPITLVGKCPNCGEESAPDTDWLKTLLAQIHATADHRLRATEQALRFGIGTQSETVLSDDDVRAWEGHVARFLHDQLTARGWSLDEVRALLVALDAHMRRFDPREAA